MLQLQVAERAQSSAERGKFDTWRAPTSIGVRDRTMKRDSHRSRPEIFDLPLRDVLFINLWFGLISYAIFRAVFD